MSVMIQMARGGGGGRTRDPISCYLELSVVHAHISCFAVRGVDVKPTTLYRFQVRGTGSSTFSPSPFFRLLLVSSRE